MSDLASCPVIFDGSPTEVRYDYNNELLLFCGKTDDGQLGCVAMDKDDFARLVVQLASPIIASMLQKYEDTRVYRRSTIDTVRSLLGI